MSGVARKIIHCDMDAFYASVEQRDTPGLKEKPVIVGGSRSRGVVCACSYQTRSFGVHSGMPMARAIQLCPSAEVLPVRMERYRDVSREVFTIFSSFTDLVEPLSIDEAFLDVTGCQRLFGSAVEIATRIRCQVAEQLDLVVSAGIAGNKFLAKLASGEAKPDGLLEISPERIEDFLLPLQVEKIWGVGAVTARTLRGHGVKTVADLRRRSKEDLTRLLGSQGSRLYELARGIDERPVEPATECKSLGAEETFARDIYTEAEAKKELMVLADRIARRARKANLEGTGLTLKVKYADFTAVTRSRVVPGGTSESDRIRTTGETLLAETEAGARPVRLLGLYLTGLQVQGSGQQELFAADDCRRQASLDAARDQLLDRFGTRGVSRASVLERSPSVQLGKQRLDGEE